MTTSYLLREQVDQVLLLLTPVNRLVMRTMLHTGLRVGDVVALRTSDIAKGRRFWITECKTGKRRMVVLSSDLHAALQANSGDIWVFPGRCDHGKHWTRQAVWQDVKRAAWAMRMDVNVGTHSARKTYAVELMHKYGDIDKVRRALNHDNCMVTMIYAMADQVGQRRRKHRKRKFAVDR